MALCGEHAPAYGRRCFDCETAFESHVNRPAVLLLPLALWMSIMLAAAIGLGAHLVEHRESFIGWLSLLTIALGMSPFSVGAAKLAYLFSARRAFLAQRSSRCGLPLDRSSESWFALDDALRGDVAAPRSASRSTGASTTAR